VVLKFANNLHVSCSALLLSLSTVSWFGVTCASQFLQAACRWKCGSASRSSCLFSWCVRDSV